MHKKYASLKQCDFLRSKDNRLRRRAGIRAKRFLALFLTVIMLLSVTACGAGTDLSDNGSSLDNEIGEDSLAEPDRTESEGAGSIADADAINLEGAVDTTDFDKRTGINGWHQFFQKSFYQVLSDVEDANCVYSPINLYLCLAMLSEISDGDTRTQITNLLGLDDQKKIRSQSQELYGKASRVVTCPVGEPEPEYDYMSELGNSLWLNEAIPFRKKQIKQLRESYYAYCGRGAMGTDEMDKKIQAWLNEKTNGKLKGQVKGIHTDADTALMLFSSIYFESAWKYPFLKEATVEEVFHGVASGNGGDASQKNGDRDTVCDFLHQIIDTNVVETEDYMAVELPMQNGVSMHIILPEEGNSVQDILEKNKTEDLLALCMGYNEKAEYARVDFSMPKFNIDSVLGLDEILKRLGVEDMFEAGKADFSPLIGSDDQESGESNDIAFDFYVDKMNQVSNMMVDENGCSVASYTEVTLESSGLEIEEKYEMHCDRPFLFAITRDGSEDDIGIPLFAGVIQNVK